MEKRIWLKEYRNKKGLTQLQVADSIPISLRYYQMIEQGRKEPSIIVANRIGKLLGFNWSEFYRGKLNEEA